jgi:hypothetical protein
VAVAEIIEEGVRSCRISAYTEKKGFEGKMKQVNHVDGGHKGKKNQFQNYHTPSQIANINLNSIFPTKKPEPLNFQAKLKIFQRRITKWSKNNYPHYHCP